MRAHTGYYYTEKGEHNKKQCVRVLWPNCDKVTARPSSGWYFKISLQYNVKSIWTHTYTLQVISKYCRKEGKWAKRNVLKSTRVKAKYVGLSHHFIVSFSPILFHIIMTLAILIINITFSPLLNLISPILQQFILDHHLPKCSYILCIYVSSLIDRTQLWTLSHIINLHIHKLTRVKKMTK